MTKPVFTIKGCYYPHLTYGKNKTKQKKQKIFLNKKLEKETRAGKMAQRLQSLVALSENLFGSQHLFGGSQLWITPVPGDTMPSFVNAGMWCTDLHAGKNTHTHK